MLHKTRGIVFRFTPYGETSIIVTIFTSAFGLQSYIVNSVRSKSGKAKIALYQPLTLLDLVVYHKENAGILRIKDINCSYAYHHLQSDPVKSSVGLFICEILNRTVKEQSHAAELCDFIFKSMEELDIAKRPENFHLLFLMKLSKYLGFGPFTKDEMGIWTMSNDEQEIFDKLQGAHYEDKVTMTNEQRRNLLDALLRFYASHIDSMGTIKSIQVLREVLG